MASVPFCDLVLQLYTDCTRKHFHKEMPFPITLLKQHLNSPSKDFQQRFGSVPLAGNTPSCGVLCKCIGLQRSSDPLVCTVRGSVFHPGEPRGRAGNPRRAQRRLPGYEGADRRYSGGEALIAGLLVCALCPLSGCAFISLTRLLKKIQGLEALRQCLVTQ